MRSGCTHCMSIVYWFQVCSVASVHRPLPPGLHLPLDMWSYLLCVVPVPCLGTKFPTHCPGSTARPNRPSPVTLSVPLDEPLLASVPLIHPYHLDFMACLYGPSPVTSSDFLLDEPSFALPPMILMPQYPNFCLFEFESFARGCNPSLNILSTPGWSFETNSCAKPGVSTSSGLGCSSLQTPLFPLLQ